ncbi:hypothetical protein D3C80_2135260 [compost metagenome]
MFCEARSLLDEPPLLIFAAVAAMGLVVADAAAAGVDTVLVGALSKLLDEAL